MPTQTNAFALELHKVWENVQAIKKHLDALGKLHAEALMVVTMIDQAETSRKISIMQNETTRLFGASLKSLQKLSQEASRPGEISALSKQLERLMKYCKKNESIQRKAKTVYQESIANEIKIVNSNASKDEIDAIVGGKIPREQIMKQINNQGPIFKTINALLLNISNIDQSVTTLAQLFQNMMLIRMKTSGSNELVLSQVTDHSETPDPKEENKQKDEKKLEENVKDGKNTAKYFKTKAEKDRKKVIDITGIMKIDNK